MRDVLIHDYDDVNLEVVWQTARRKTCPRSFSNWKPTSPNIPRRNNFSDFMFELVAPYQPAGDQPLAIAKLTDGILSGVKHQTLLGVTGSGKTFTVANVIRNVDKPTLVISHNKTLAAQLYAEFKSFFPNNAVEYFVSYFDHYQPEAYIPRTDTFIGKDSSRNDEIERLRLSTMSSLFSRRDVVVVASMNPTADQSAPW